MPTATVPVITVVVVRLGIPAAVEVGMGVWSGVWVGVLDTAMAMAIAPAAQRLITDSCLPRHPREISSDAMHHGGPYEADLDVKGSDAPEVREVVWARRML